MMRQLVDLLREFFLLRGAERQVRALPLGRQLEIRGEVDRAVVTMREASHATDASLRIELARAALARLLAGNALAMGAARDTETGESEAPQRTVFAHARARSLPPAFERTLSELEDPEAGQPANDAHFDHLVRLFAWLEARLETRTPRELQLSRIVRLLTVMAAVVLGGWWLWSPKNLARGQPVFASSVCSLAPPPRAGKPRLERVVDGVHHEVTFAVCTGIQQHPWITIDLNRSRHISEVVIYHRTDCCWGIADLPLQVQLSDDNSRFETAGTVDQPYTVDFPARVRVDGHTGRYVRLFNPTPGPTHITISEVEVYGR